MRPCHILRVFTRDGVGGNHLGVVTDITGLDPATMQAIATDLGFSETIFIDWRDEGPPHVRIFTPAMELPFAGHPLVGAAWVLSAIGPGTADRVTCGVGEIPFHMEDETSWVATPLVRDVERADDGESIAAAANLPRPVRAWRAMMPLPYLVLDLGSAETVAEAQPDITRLSDLGASMTYLMGEDDEGLKVRFFAPDAGVPEDPATGSAASALAAVRVFEGQPGGELVLRQGDEIGHPSTILLRWDESTASLGGTVRRDEVRVLE